MTRATATTLLLGALLAGCADDPRAWMTDVRAASERADAAEARGDHAAAIDALEAILSREAPRGLAAEDLRVVRQDAHERLGRASLARGDVDRAAAHAREGLALGEREEIFTANLLALAGRVAEARGDDREAARAYHRALVIHEALLERALGGER
ncbi:MAG: hypothetical protein KF729_17675 [Sandaracinaceae bacterium]|nr:hypothetical protein [Sandaracinaceae bacterium]